MSSLTHPVSGLMRDQHESGRIRGWKCWCLHTSCAPNGETTPPPPPGTRRRRLCASSASSYGQKWQKIIKDVCAAHTPDLAGHSASPGVRSAFVAAHAQILSLASHSLRHYWIAAFLGYGCAYCWNRRILMARAFVLLAFAISVLLFSGRGFWGAKCFVPESWFWDNRPAPLPGTRCWFSTIQHA